MTGKTAQTFIGRKGYFETSEGIEVLVRVDDWKMAYGRDLYLLIPTDPHAKGSKWSTLERFRWIVGIDGDEGCPEAHRGLSARWQG